MRANVGKTGDGLLAIKWITLGLVKLCTANDWLSVQVKAYNVVPNSFSIDRTPTR